MTIDFSETTRTLYGNTSSGAYCPIRDRTALFVQDSDIWLQWALLSAEVYRLGRKAATKSLTVLSRRAILYRAMRELLDYSPYEYNTMAHITLAAVIEDRIGSVEQAQKHMIAVRRLLYKSRNHKVSVPITTLSVLAYLGAGADTFENLDKLNTAIDTFVAAMLKFQMLQSRVQASHLVSLRATAMDTNDSETLEFFTQFIRISYQTYRLDPPDPVSWGDLNLPTEAYNEDFRQARARMAIVWILNRILHDFHDDEKGSRMGFLAGLRRLIGVHNVAEVKPMTMMLACLDFMAKMRSKQPFRTDVTTMDSMQSDGEGDRRITWWWECIEAVESLVLLPKEMRARLMKLCCSWVADVGQASEELTIVECADVGQEIRLSWLMS